MWNKIWKYTINVYYYNYVWKFFKHMFNDINKYCVRLAIFNILLCLFVQYQGAYLKVFSSDLFCLNIAIWHNFRRPLIRQRATEFLITYGIYMFSRVWYRVLQSRRHVVTVNADKLKVETERNWDRESTITDAAVR